MKASPITNAEGTVVRNSSIMPRADRALHSCRGSPLRANTKAREASKLELRGPENDLYRGVIIITPHKASSGGFGVTLPADSDGDDEAPPR
eukprot:3629663-Alexandrium_andersonii.AAC.1